MARTALILARIPHAEDDAERTLGYARYLKESGDDVALYLLGDAVLLARSGMASSAADRFWGALSAGVQVFVSENDLRARALGEDRLAPGVSAILDIEGAIVDDVMGKSERVISW